MNSLKTFSKALATCRHHFLKFYVQREMSSVVGSSGRVLYGVQQFDTAQTTTSHHPACRVQVPSVGYTSVAVKQPSLWDRAKNQMGITGRLKYPKAKLKLSGYNMYTCCQAQVDLEQMFRDLNLPDTFNSWFLVTELHVWMCMVRLAVLDKEGRVVRNSLVEAMWADVDRRSKQLGNAASLTARKEGIKDLGGAFYAALFSYDEGILGDDRELAGAVWRILFEREQDKEAHQLALMVEYVRKQVHHMDQQDSDLMLRRGVVTLLPLYGDKLNVDEVNSKLLAIYSKKMVS
ncbi:ubiquinol-cytochrome-c reductase complex assembly factor 1-like [Haliotis rufescens]|uniref:ubiquinol-cytochrome-c reductase complex assembly factor 1-like n=1 Tax=Haliotis rufescens TaxID=6454 RepID=UPI00201E8A4F|nr:ubiquinol-cytochrome-c reductase complex assembly factor 1-like [Haliotis rufescens]